ncbi:hypothetical protein ACERK3_07745 [Phycisphaerales bacterium AB-hyl4]|uniref:Uncharacterized protein n=1 Tax=Natronomicrosphaera hydrolytica TaxID=3242702 RepID=A0ABV4U3L3_9BACT
MMRQLLGEWPQIVKFVCLSLTMLMAASSAASLVFGYAMMAIASAVVAGWSLSVCLDVWRAEIIRDLSQPQHNHEHAN